ncbi:anaphase-promoting complex subunit ApcB [Apiospora arundinis]|uniref:Anaphase-promoting complex subunit 2 n=1 Tax=Apiospora arundinis TaxID=335852 RepID=A0ABR2JA38_9PEZI
MADTKWNAAKRRVFQSVFHTSFSQPTPTSTPSLGNWESWEAGQSFGGPLASTPQKQVYVPSSQEPRLPFSPENPHASDQTRFDRSWHAVTSRIALPPSVTAEDSFGPLPSPQDGDDDDLFMAALDDILHPSARLPLATHTEDILSWHTQQVRLHFVNHVVPLLSICDTHADQTQVLLGSMRTLEAAHRQYVFGLSLVLRGMNHGDADTAFSKFRRDLHAIVGNSVSNSLVAALRSVLERLMATVLGVCGLPMAQQQGDQDSAEVEEARREVLQLVESLYKIGLAGERFQILFAEILNELMIAYLHKSFAGVWEKSEDAHTLHPQPRCVKQLMAWIEDRYARLAVEVTNQLDNVQVSWTDVEKWKEIALGRLAALRITELFDIVMNWPDSEGGVEDLRYAVTTPRRRLQLTDAFSSALQKRLLHPGRSTLDILRTYISMIRTFQKLDHSRVLLDRVAYSLQLYLCTREDTVRIIVTSLLSNPKETLSEARKVKLVELVELLHDPNQNRSERQDDEWDDLSWVPPPIDAGLNYKRSKSEDVIGTLIGALGSPDVFIKEFQNIIGERLLSDQVGFEQEVVVLDLLKKRFGESSLQACDVMMKDIEDSVRLDGVIQRGAVNHPDKTKHDWTIHTKILSRLYWPDMGEEPFVVPEDIVAMQKMYETIFEHLKPTRTLKWLNHLGQAKVELELEDRTISEEVQTYEAAVISAFSEHAVSGRSPSWTFDDLWMHLQMDEDLLASALRFWERKQVLRKLPSDEYVVMERLEPAEQQLASDNKLKGSSAANTAPTPRKAKPSGLSEKEKEKRQVYWQFIVGMLTNSSPAMPLGQIAMMMKMLIADGFPWSNEELQEFLGDKIADGELELAGGKYKLIKK